jgi:phage repressor protein C with HTH and peptisase S24 domain
MLTHTDIWTAIDRLAVENSLTPSGLARRAGLDPTTFNRSKRVSRDGKTRWPSTESIAKILEATNTSLRHLVDLTIGMPPESNRRCVPLTSLAQVRAGNHFDSGGHPAGGNWDETILPEVLDPHAYAIEVSGDELEPVFRDGDILIVSPSAALRRGDRVVVSPVDGPLMIGRLVRRTAKHLHVDTIGVNARQARLELTETAWLARIIWASQ